MTYDKEKSVPGRRLLKMPFIRPLPGIIVSDHI